jgi:hypothetical protein
MPDWSYHPLTRLILDKISPKTSREFIHNRAGFGSALVSVGLLVLMLSLGVSEKGKAGFGIPLL